ncbi:MAG: N-acetylglucosamine-6-phosphate deacetylase [Rhizobiales bacterium]|nr:N-acetylglucosamine-6-phosphate deacetylase [Hyphomicrobiales bacterium]MBI3673042.1 N-acetylglucosamine-6-phosphate deacetylase [Hyphomicrobiales bacterium]
MAFALTGARLFDGEAMRDGMAVVIDGGRIAAVCAEAEVPGSIERRKLEGGVLAPGFIDVQVNGGGGALLNDRPSVETVRRIAESHRAFGTTGLLPTVITDAPEVTAAAIAAVKAGAVPGVLGIHIEGPFLDVARKGAHEARFIRAMTVGDVEKIAAADCGAVMLTLAPNRVPPALVKQLAERGVLVSLGHAEATCEEASVALTAGARAFTHIFNAMSQMNGREPGMVGAALADRECFVGLIADGFHVHDAAMRVVLAAKPRSRIMLVTDAMPTAAGGPDHFTLQGREVRREHGRLQLADGTLAGSNLTMDEAVRYCMTQLGVRLEDALTMASLAPAAFLRRDHELGRIRADFLASLVHLSDDLAVRQTWIEGR